MRSVAASFALLMMLISRAVAAPEPFTVVVFPDTQNFSMNHPEIYEAMCRWIVEHRQDRNIVFASHVGDIVNNDTKEQWANARRAHDVLSAAGLPYGMAIGNHDGGDMYNHHMVGENYLANFGPGALYDTTDPSKGTFAEQPWYAGRSPTGLSSFQVLPRESTGGLALLFLHLEVGLREADVAWAEQVVKDHADHAVIISTHRYLYDYRTIRGRWGGFVARHFDPPYMGQDHDGDSLFERLKSHRNVMMIWCGHVDADYRQVSINAAGLPVHEVLQDYQSFSPYGGNGWMRLYTFDPARGEVRVQTYSPTADGGRSRTADDQLAELRIAMRSYSDEAERRAGISLQGLDPQIQAALLAAFAKPGAASGFIETVRTGDGPFAWIFPAIERLAGDDAPQALAMLRGFPYDRLSPGLVRLFDREGATLLAPLLKGDDAAFERLMTENNNARLTEAFLADGDREPAFTLKIDFAAYTAAPALAAP